MHSAAILALTGGGMMARFSTHILEHLQQLRNNATGRNNTNSPLRECFDIMAGTSAGALCVAGLVVGRSPEELSRLFDERGPLIFPSRKFGELRHLLTAKYNPRALHDAVAFALNGNDPLLGDIEPIVAFPAFDETEGIPVVLTNAEPGHAQVRLSDAVLASAAAPTYFPAHRIAALRNHRFIDGGVYSNAPDLAAITIALSSWPDLTTENIHLISVGTTNTSSRSPYHDQHIGAMGVIAWARKPRARILKLTMRSQVDHTMALLRELNLASFVRIDTLLPSRKAEQFSLDDASAETLQTLVAAGKEAIKAMTENQLGQIASLVGRNRFVSPNTTSASCNEALERPASDKRQ